jgi:hypothetical protein
LQVWIVSFIVTAAVIALPAAWALLPTRWTLPVEQALEAVFARVESALGRLAFWRRNTRQLSFSFGRRDSNDGALTRSSSVNDDPLKK